MSDAFFDECRFWVHNGINVVCRDCRAAVVNVPIGGACVPRKLGLITDLRGYLCLVISDSSREMDLNAIIKWQADRTQKSKNVESPNGNQTRSHLRHSNLLTVRANVIWAHGQVLFQGRSHVSRRRIFK